MSPLAKQFRNRFRAASLFISTCSGAARVAKSNEQTAVLRTLLEEGQPMQDHEHAALAELVVSTEQIWESSDRASILLALSKAVCKRRGEQKWSSALLDIFTEEEWARWKAAGPDGMDWSLDQVLARVKSIGGKNLCEYSKKLLTAIWLHLRGDGLRMSRIDRNVAKEHVKGRLSRIMRKFNPMVYMETLDLNVYRQHHSDLYAAAYGQSAHCPLPGADKAAILYLDGLMSCRGVGTDVLGMHGQLAPVQLPTMPLPQQIQNPILEMLVPLLGQLANSMRQQGPNDECNVVFNNGIDTPSPRGRPMRSCDNMNPNRRMPPVFPGLQGSLMGPPPVEGAEDNRDELSEVARQMMQRAGKGEGEKVESGHGDGGADEGGEGDVPPKCSMKAAKVMKAHKKVMKAMKVMKMMTAKPPSIAWERTRFQVRCNTGKGGKGSSLLIPFKDNGGPKGAWAKAQAWLRGEKKEYEKRCKKG